MLDLFFVTDSNKEDKQDIYHYASNVTPMMLPKKSY